LISFVLYCRCWILHESFHPSTLQDTTQPLWCPQKWQNTLDPKLMSNEVFLCYFSEYDLIVFGRYFVFDNIIYSKLYLDIVKNHIAKSMNVMNLSEGVLFYKSMFFSLCIKCPDSLLFWTLIFVSLIWTNFRWRRYQQTGKCIGRNSHSWYCNVDLRSWRTYPLLSTSSW
jgi:hypothetical protein